MDDEPLITVRSVIPNCGRAPLSTDDLVKDTREQFEKGPYRGTGRKRRDMFVEIATAQRNYARLLTFTEPLSDNGSQPAFLYLWELIRFYKTQIEALALDLDACAVSKYQKSAEELQKVLEDKKPPKARDDLSAEEISCMTTGELALEVALQKRGLGRTESTRKVWDQPFEATNGLPVTAFIGVAPPKGGDGGARLIVTSSAEVWNAVPRLQEWCWESRAKSLACLDKKIREQPASGGDGVLEDLLEAHRAFEASQTHAGPSGWPLLAGTVPTRAAQHWVLTHAAGRGYVYCAAAGQPLRFTDWMPTARCPSCRACRHWYMPPAVQQLEWQRELELDKQLRHPDLDSAGEEEDDEAELPRGKGGIEKTAEKRFAPTSCAENSAFLIYRYLANDGV